MYKQCLLRKKNTIRIGFIPVEHATLGKYVKLKEEDSWSTGWLVVEVHDHAISKDQLGHVRSAQRNRKDTLKI